jgi:hypothetical protein
MASLEHDDEYYVTHIQMGTNSSITVDLNVPSEPLYDYYFKILYFITKSAASGVVHLHSSTLSSDKSYNNITLKGDLIGSYLYTTTYTRSDMSVSSNDFSYPVPNWLNNNPKVTFYLTDINFASVSLTSVDFAVAIFKKKRNN